MDNHDELTRLAREHMAKCYAGQMKIGIGFKHKKFKTVSCSICGKSVDVPDFENSPYYCYRKHEEEDVEELESALR